MSGPALPAELAAAIEALLEGRPRAALAASARRLSESYRARRPTSDAICDETDALAYALTRMPATYAAVQTTLARLAEARPDFAPRGLLDVGCGLGAATYAASALWPGVEPTLLDRSLPFLRLAQQLAQQGGAAARMTFVEADLARLPAQAAQAACDLVIAAYALTELDEGILAPLAKNLWSQTAGALVIVEPGTPRDYARLMQVRAALIAQGAMILAPCPHAGPCTLAPPDWCHFSVRLPRRRDHKLLKQAEAPFEDEKFCYLVATRTRAEARGEARILAPRHANKAGITLKLCTSGGISETFIPKRDKPRYEGIRKKDWGDTIAAPPEAKGPETI